MVDGQFLQDYPSLLLETGKLAAVPSLIGTTTNELIDFIPIYDAIGTNAALLQLIQNAHPYVNSSTLEELLLYYPQEDYTNDDPPLSGAEWSRLVAITNDLGIFCPVYGADVGGFAYIRSSNMEM